MPTKHFASVARRPSEEFGLVLGRKGQFGLLSDAVVDCSDVAKLTTFCKRSDHSDASKEVYGLSDAVR